MHPPLSVFPRIIPPTPHPKQTSRLQYQPEAASKTIRKNFDDPNCHSLRPRVASAISLKIALFQQGLSYSVANSENSNGECAVLARIVKVGTE